MPYRIMMMTSIEIDTLTKLNFDKNFNLSVTINPH